MSEEHDSSVDKSPSKKVRGEKVLGYTLLAVGILIIFSATYLVFGVLAGRAKPPKVFNVQAPTFRLPSPNTNLELPQGVTLPEGVRLNQNTSQTPEDIKLIPDELLNGIVNIGLYYLAMMFVASSGLKVASLGIKLIKDIKVQIKADKIKVP